MTAVNEVVMKEAGGSGGAVSVTRPATLAVPSTRGRTDKFDVSKY